MKLLTAIVGVSLLPLALAAQRGANPEQVEAVKAKYRKLEVRIPMRDGVKLFTSIYVPRDTSRSYPIPHGPHAVRRRALRRRRVPHVARPERQSKVRRAGFIFVYQDARGRYYSEGALHRDDAAQGREEGSEADVDESTDTYDTIDWLVKNIPHNNGRVGIYGTSYPGFYTTASCIDPHPALKACEPGAPMTDLWMGDDLFHNGAFMLGANFDFYQGYGRTPRSRTAGPDPRYPASERRRRRVQVLSLDMGPVGPGSRKWLPPETAPLWDVVMHHPSYDDYWKARDISRHVKRVPAMLEVGGYYDAEDLAGPWRTFRGIEKLGAGLRQSHRDRSVVARRLVARRRQRARHAALGDEDGAVVPRLGRVPVLHALSDGRRRWRRCRRCSSIAPAGRRWDRYDAWPPKNADRRSRSICWPDGSSVGRSRRAGERGKGAAFDEYVSDPANPVPVVGRKPIASGMPRDYMTGDQRFASSAAGRAHLPDRAAHRRRDDRRARSTPVLHVATSGTDADFDVKLIDVFPDDAPNWPGDTTGFKVAGYQQLVRGEPFRGRYRRDPAKPVAFVPNQPGLAALRDARHQPHVQERAPHHGAGAELVVPAHRSQSADVRAEHLRGEAGGLQERRRWRVPHADR